MNRKQLEDELDEFVRKNLGLSANDQESQKFFHNQVTKPYFQPRKIVEDVEGNLLMITNGEEETVEGLVGEAETATEGTGPKEMIIGAPSFGKTSTLKSTLTAKPSAE
jgi:hypothetical protein